MTFDVFDTLLWRRVLFPADVFDALPRGGSSWRRLAETAATVWCRRVLRREPRLSDIYRLYPFEAAHELDIEAQLGEPSPWCLALVRDLVARGVKLAAVSDMYLSAAHIATLLRGAGYPDLPVFVSSDTNLSKQHDGRLFVHVGMSLNAHPERWMHVGDNAHADIAMAQRHGLSVCQVRTPRDTLLALSPAISQQRRTPEDALFLGELAIALHQHLASMGEPSQALADRVVRALKWPRTRRAGEARVVLAKVLATTHEGDGP